jgi:hypothetical protein
MKATGLALKPVDMSRGVKAINRRVANTTLLQTQDQDGVACMVETEPGSEDQYGGVTVPIVGKLEAAYRIEVTFISPRDIGRVCLQANGDKRHLKWVWNTDAFPAAAGKHVIVFRPGKPSSPFELHPQSDSTFDAPKNAQLYIRPLHGGAKIGFILHRLEASA